MQGFMLTAIIATEKYTLVLDSTQLAVNYISHTQAMQMKSV